jgi:hypothetical protein
MPSTATLIRSLAPFALSGTTVGMDFSPPNAAGVTAAKTAPVAAVRRKVLLELLLFSSIIKKFRFYSI